jgi:ribosomal protein S18 acetylase RimI-like enzyme
MGEDGNLRQGPVPAETIRPVQAGDKAAVRALFQSALEATYPDLLQMPRALQEARVQDEFEHYWAMEDKWVWVSDFEGSVVGCLWCLESWHPVTGAKDLFVVIVAVAPEFRGRGIAQRLFEAGMNHALALGLPYMRLAVNPINHAAYRLYERLGFTTQTHEMRMTLDRLQATGEGPW